MSHPSAELLSAFVDQALPQARQEKVATHLVGCRTCRDEVVELRELRACLGGSSAGATAPGRLADSLVALAGRNGDAPLWLCAEAPGTRLPSQRLALRRRVAATSVVAAGAMLCLLALGLAMAPNLPSVIDPVRLASDDLTAAGQWGGAGRAENLVASDAARLATHVTSATPLPVIEQGVSIDTDTALELLSTGLSARTSYAGTVDVVLADREPCVHGTVEVSESPGTGLKLVAHEGGRAVTARVADTGRLALTSDAGGDMEFRLLTGAVVADTPALVIEGRRADDSLAERWWVNPQLGVLLARESWSASGQLLRSARFTEITYDAVVQAAPTPAPAEAKAAWCLDEFVCPDTLAGLPRLSIDADSDYEPTVVRATYGDGRSTLTLVQQRGSLASGIMANRGAAWQSGTIVLAVMGTKDGLVAAAYGELPHLAPVDSTFGRAKVGLQQLADRNR